MMLIETRVQPSAIHGMGLFTVKFVPRGATVWKFQPGFDHDFSPAQFSALPPLAQQHTRHFCFVSKVDGHVILSGDHACFINHSPTPNSGAPPPAPPPVITVALRDIAPGEEITCNYFDYDADTRWKLGLVPNDAPLGADVITSTAERQAAIEFAKAAAMRPQIVGQALQKISEDRDISHALFKVLETQNIIDGHAGITLIPKGANMLGELVAGAQAPEERAASS